jgi:hypothetical protein
LGASDPASGGPLSVPASGVAPPWQAGVPEPSLIFTAAAANVEASQELSWQSPGLPVVEQ